MRHIFLSLFALFIAIALPVQDAEAKRLGGARSSGMQRDSLPDRPAAPAQRNADAPGPNVPAAAPAAAPGKRSWLGPVAGLAAGLGLAALASHLGLGEEFANILLIALLVLGGLFLFRMLSRKRAPVQPMQYAGQGAGGNFPGGNLGGNLGGGLGGAAAQPAATPAEVGGFPPGFDAEAFTRQAKLNFIRLQAANDAGNLDDIREFTTPEMYAEIKLQLAERGNAPQETEVMQLDAQVLDCREEAQRLIVSVRFHGLIREEADTPAAPFDEIWHLAKPADGSRGWAIAGIQQRQ